MYILALNRIKPGIDVEKLRKTVPKHIEWVDAGISIGTIVQAGKWGDKGGIVIFSVDNIAEVEKALSHDPLVLESLIEVELAEFFPHVEFNAGKDEESSHC